VIDVVPDDKNIPEAGGWTLEAFRDHVGKQMAELDLRYQQRFDAQEKAMQQGWRRPAEQCSKVKQHSKTALRA
jgi:hypothetical protein